MRMPLKNAQFEADCPLYCYFKYLRYKIYNFDNNNKIENDKKMIPIST